MDTQTMKPDSRYSQRLAQLEPHWKRGLGLIPAKRHPSTPTTLRERIELLWRAQGRPFDTALMRWDVNRLFAEWFERTAERILSDRYPIEHTHLRMAEDREASMDPRRGRRAYR